MNSTIARLHDNQLITLRAYRKHRFEMLPQRKNVSCLWGSSFPRSKIQLCERLENPFEVKRQTGEKKFSKSITICGVWTKIQQAYLDCKPENWILSVKFFTRSRSEVGTLRETTTHRQETMLAIFI